MYRELPEYQPARYLVRVWDGDRDPGTEARYDSWRGRLTPAHIRDLADIHLSACIEQKALGEMALVAAVTA